MKSTLLIIFPLVLLMGVGVYWHQKESVIDEGTENKITFDKSDVTFIKTLKYSDGTVLGDLNILDFNSKNQTFSALFVSKLIDGKNIIIYQVDANGSSNTIGQDSKGSGKQRFYALRLESVGADNFTYYILTDDGKGISDALVVRWNKDKNVFELFKPDFDDPDLTEDVLAGVLRDSGGAVLGELSVRRSDIDGNLLKALFVSTSTPNESWDPYRITEDGFFNENGQEQEILGPDFYGFELVDIKDDHFTIRILYEKGNIKSDDITVGWDTKNKIFKVLSE